MTRAVDALVIGAGPAGSATAILLARAGWEVVLVEQDVYPRRKVCGECVSAAGLAMLDDLGVGEGVRAHAGPELRSVGFMSHAATVMAEFPAFTAGPHRYGRALRREHLDKLLVDRAAGTGVRVLQPVRVRAVQPAHDSFRCDLAGRHDACHAPVHAHVVIDAHGSWQRGPAVSSEPPPSRRLHRASDLFAFKAVFRQTALTPGLLPVMALPGAYGGMVIADEQLATLACCLRRDALAACRAAAPGLAVGDAVEAWLRRHCLGVREALEGALHAGAWLTVGPLNPGTTRPASPFFRVGNSAGESHPLIGEGIGMALQSAALLAAQLGSCSPARIDRQQAQRRYAVTWRREFAQRMRVAALYAQVAMRPRLSVASRALMRQWPGLLTRSARLAGKTRPPVPMQLSQGISHEHA